MTIPSPENFTGGFMDSTLPQDYMLKALALAERGRFSVSPNPMVGCILVQGNTIVGSGWHERAGESHAEIYALKEAGLQAKGATAYVTLEPCCHQGRTPPCTEALIKAGIKKVYIACLDPNPLVSGKGVAALCEAGIIVEVGLEEEKAKNLNKIFFHYITHKRPFVIAKWAMSLDGKTITHPVDLRQISCKESSHHTHSEIRQQVDAILVGANTAAQDDPSLTTRIEGKEIDKQPIRIILSSDGALPKNLKIFTGKLPGKTIVVTTKPLTISSVEIIVVAKDKNNRIDLHALLQELGKRQITSLLVEGGMTVHESFFEQDLVNQISVYVAPVIIGNMEKKKKFENVDFGKIGEDFYFSL